MGRKLGVALAAAMMFGPVAAQAQSPTVQALAGGANDALSTCMIAHTTEADRTTLVRWIFAMLSASPKIEDMSKVTAAQRDGFSKQAGALMTRLLTVDCRPQAVDAIKTQGQKAMEKGFGLLSGAAVEDLMKDPAVSRAMLGILAGADLRALGELMIDGGVKPGRK